MAVLRKYRGRIALAEWCLGFGLLIGWMVGLASAGPPEPRIVDYQQKAQQLYDKTYYKHFSRLTEESHARRNDDPT